MLKFIKHHVASIMGIEIYPLISFVIFFVFFIAVLWYVIKADKSHIDKLSALPLDLDNEQEAR